MFIEDYELVKKQSYDTLILDSDQECVLQCFMLTIYQ